MKIKKTYRFWFIALITLTFLAFGTSTGYTDLGDHVSGRGAGEEGDKDDAGENEQPSTPSNIPAGKTPDSIKKAIEEQMKAAANSTPTEDAEDLPTQVQDPTPAVETDKKEEAIKDIANGNEAVENYIKKQLEDIDKLLEDYPDKITCDNGAEIEGIKEEIKNSFDQALIDEAYSLKTEGLKIQQTQGNNAYKKYLLEQLYKISAAVEQKVVDEQCDLAVFDFEGGQSFHPDYADAGEAYGEGYDNPGSTSSSGIPGLSSGSSSGSHDGHNHGSSTPLGQQSYPPVDPNQVYTDSQSFPPGSMFLAFRSVQNSAQPAACTFMVDQKPQEDCLKKLDEVLATRSDSYGAASGTKMEPGLYKNIWLVCSALGSNCCNKDNTEFCRTNSGYRSPEHPVEARKKTPGNHARMRASDTVFPDKTPREVYNMARIKNPGGSGNDTTNTHIDYRGPSTLSGGQESVSKSKACWKYSPYKVISCNLQR